MRAGESRRPSRAFRVATVAVGVVALAALPSAVRVIAGDPVIALAWVLFLSATSALRVDTVPSLNVETTLRTPATVASLVVLDPSVAFLVNLVALASVREIRGGANGWMILFNHAHNGLRAYALGLALQAVPGNVTVLTLLAVPLQDALNVVVIAGAAHLLGRSSFTEAARKITMPFPRFAVNKAVIGLLALLIVVLYVGIAPWSLGLLVLPLWLGHAAQESARVASERAAELAARVRELEVVHDLGTAVLSVRDQGEVVGLGRQALREICEEAVSCQPVVALDGSVPEGLQRRVLPGTEAVVGLPPDLDERRAAQVETVCSTIGLALQRLRVEEELRASQQAQARLAEGILAEGTKARSRVALHVHDEVLPFLAAAEIQSENVVTAAELGNPSMTISLAHKVGDAVSDGIKTLREVIEDLRKQTIVPGDLVPFVRQAAEKAQLEHGIRVDLDVDDYAGDLTHPVEILVTETVTNLLCNAVKHARASRIQIRVVTGPELVTAEVRDDGVGFDPDEVGVDRHGIALMRQRAALANGHFFVGSAPGKGTRICLMVPIATATPPPSLGRYTGGEARAELLSGPRRR